MLRIFTRVLSHLVHLWTKIKMSWLCRWPLASSSSKAQTHGRLKCWYLNLLHISYHVKRFMACLNVVPFSLSYIFLILCMLTNWCFSDKATHCVPKCFLEEWCIYCMFFIKVTQSKLCHLRIIQTLKHKKKQHQNTEK